MSWLTRWLRPPALDASQRAALEAYAREQSPDPQALLSSTRFVVADVETSGLDPTRDRLISIGAVTVENGLVHLGRSFEAVVRQETPSPPQNILIHQIDGTTQLSGAEPARALLQFLGFAGKAPLIGYHAGFDRTMIARAMDEFLGIRLENAWLDLAILAPALLPERAPASAELDLDDWLAAFGIDNYARHDAVADAVATAELFLVVLAAALRRGHRRLADLHAEQHGARWLGLR